ncbi:hypothetical protein ES703_75441 [subsurface metagenome]
MEDKTEFQEMNERDRTFIHWKKIDIHTSIILLSTLYDLGFEREKEICIIYEKIRNELVKSYIHD